MKCESSSRSARRQFETAAAWWREHRDRAPYMFEDEVMRAVKLLEATLFAGAAGRDARVNTVRRVVLLQTQYFLYYRVRVREASGTVELLRLWHTNRRPPKR